jgi:hypothetical protein
MEGTADIIATEETVLQFLLRKAKLLSKAWWYQNRGIIPNPGWLPLFRKAGEAGEAGGEKSFRGDNQVKRLAELGFHPLESSKTLSLLTGLLRIDFWASWFSHKSILFEA